MSAGVSGGSGGGQSSARTATTELRLRHSKARTQANKQRGRKEAPVKELVMSMRPPGMGEDVSKQQRRKVPKGKR